MNTFTKEIWPKVLTVLLIAAILFTPSYKSHAQAAQGILIVVTIGVVCGVVIYTYVQVKKSLDNMFPPPTNQVDQVSGTIETTDWRQDGGVLVETVTDANVWPYIVTASWVYATSGPLAPQTVSTDNPFEISYGLDMNTNPWVNVGAVTVSPFVLQSQTVNSNSVSLIMNINTASIAGARMSDGGGLLQLAYVTTNLSGTNTTTLQTDSNFTGGTVQTNNADGDTITATLSYFNTSTVKIQRSTNMVSWQTVFQTTGTPGAVGTFDDPQIFRGAFYRVVKQ